MTASSGVILLADVLGQRVDIHPRHDASPNNLGVSRTPQNLAALLYWLLYGDRNQS